MSKIETTSKVSRKLTSRINLWRQGARAELPVLETAHKPPPDSLERASPQPPNPAQQSASDHPSENIDGGALLW